jgi:amiloride-sensitive sodium channel
VFPVEKPHVPDSQHLTHTLCCFDRAFWAVVVLTAVVCAVFIMAIEWNFHLSKYTITSVDTAHYPLWNVPFPAVTVCGFNKVQRSQAHDFINELYVLL